MPTHPQTSTNIYADDTVTLATYKNHNTITLALNNHLYLLQNFFDTWKIKINVDKTVAVLFTRRKTQPTPPTLYYTQLQWSQSTKYLGLILDKKLTWKQHLTHKRDKFRKALRALYTLIGWNSQLNMYNKILLYTAVLQPILTYGSPVWGYAADANIKILEVAQRTRLLEILNSSAAEQFHSDASLEAVDRRAPNNSKNWQWKMTSASGDLHLLRIDRTASSRQLSARWSTAIGVLMSATSIR
ncbi:RNA-directed DNA polymerase from mobile element jockey [Trichonephila clavipes]|nr:RNA-directed DNA polymerase from mobile element jockey [Trichonephila clavipes]